MAQWTPSGYTPEEYEAILAQGRAAQAAGYSGAQINPRTLPATAGWTPQGYTPQQYEAILAQGRQAQAAGYGPTQIQPESFTPPQRTIWDQYQQQIAASSVTPAPAPVLGPEQTTSAPRTLTGSEQTGGAIPSPYQFPQEAPRSNFGFQLMQLLLDSQRMGTAKFKSASLNAQEEQANRIFQTPQSLIGASPSQQAQARGASVGAMGPTIQGAEQLGQTFGEQIGAFGQSVRDVRGYLQEEATRQDTERAEARDNFSKAIAAYGSKAFDILDKNQLKLAGYTPESINIARKKLEEQELAQKVQKQAYTEVSPGATLYDPATGKAIYTAPTAAKEGAGFTLSPGQQRFDEQGRPVAQVAVTPGSDLTATRRDYEYAQQQGYRGTFFDYQRDINAARASGTLEGQGRGTSAVSPGQIVNAGTGLPVKLSNEQSQFFSMGQRLETVAKEVQTLINQVGTAALKGWVTEKGFLIPVVQNALDPQQQELMQKMFELNNTFVYFSTGKQINETEFERLAKQTPNFRATPQYNATAITQFTNMINDRMNNYLRNNGWTFAGGTSAGGGGGSGTANDPLGIR